MIRIKIPILAGAILLLSGCNKDEAPPTPEALPVLRVEDQTLPEGDEQSILQFPVTVTGPRREAVSLSYETVDGTAGAELDYVPVWGELVFPPGPTDSTQLIPIRIYGNRLPEPDEFFELRFFDVKNAEPEQALARITLLNDDVPPDTFPGYTTPLEYEGMTLVWRDEFDQIFFQSNWTHALGDGCPNLCGWGNSQLQYYRPENTTVDNGLLTITAREESYGGRAYTSSRILSKDRFEFRYGRVDIRARLPRGGKGIWPALWMLGANRDEVGWPESGEIDIMEMRGSNPSRVCGTLHYADADGDHHNTGARCYSFFGQTFSDEFHVFSIIWDEEHIAWYLDDQKFNEERFDELNLGGAPNPFQKEFYFLMNVAVGGHYDGDPNASTVFPQKMEVDYIRVFQEN